MKRDSRITADITEQTHELLREAAIKFDSSKGKLLERMIKSYLGGADVAEPVAGKQVVVIEKEKPKTKKAQEVIAYPESLNVEAWDKWVAFRKKAKFATYKTDATIIKLSKMGNHDEQMKIVDNSIDAQYQGLFPLKASNKAANKTDGNLSACEAFING